MDPKGSNELLFSLLFEKFRAIHDREHFLSSEVAAGYLDHLYSRHRDLTQHPFPFHYRAAAAGPCNGRPGFQVCFVVTCVCGSLELMAMVFFANQNTPEVKKERFLISTRLDWGDGLAQWLERRIQRTKVRIPSGSSTRKICEFFRVKNVVRTHCRCAQPNPCVSTHTQEWSHVHVKDPVVHVRV